MTRSSTPSLRGELDQRLQVAVGRVHAAFRDEPDEVHARGVAQRLEQHLVLGQRPVLDRLVDAHEVLLDDRPRAEVEVADLRVAHLPLGQPYARAAGGQRGVVVLLPESVEHRRVGERDRVARPIRRQPPAVEDHQADGGDRASRRGGVEPARDLDDARERVGIEAGAADERAVDVGKGEQLLGVLGLQRAAVEDPDRLARGLVDLLHQRAHERHRLLRLLGRRRVRPVPIAQIGS